ncbi:MAG: tetratricopeptide repeat protein [Cyclobacteriaceae bacterium]|nr:tetratricopeptide repeat protein [Cyclobacteriaceae bacterium]
MSEQHHSAIRREVADYMYLVATRNRAGIEAKASEFIGSLENHTDPEILGLCHFVRGITHFFNNRYHEASEDFNKIFDLPHDLPEIWGIAHMGLGFNHRSEGHLDQAVIHLFSAVELIDKYGEFKKFIAYCYQSLGEIHTTINEYELAIHYFTDAYTSSVDDVDQSAYFRYHMGLGGCYLKMKSYEKSQQHLVMALEVKDRPLPIIARAKNDLGILYLETKDYANAKKTLLNCLTIREANGLEDAASTTMTALAEVYLETNQLEEARQLLTRAMTIVTKYQTKWKKIQVLKLLARLHATTGQFAQAVDYFEQYITLYDEIKGEQERNILKFKNAQIETQKQVISDKHTQLAATLEEIKRLKVNRKAVISSWITIILLVIVSEQFLDPLIENYAYNQLLSLLAKAGIALLFKPIDGLYEKILWNKAIRKVT